MLKNWKESFNKTFEQTWASFPLSSFTQRISFVVLVFRTTISVKVIQTMTLTLFAFLNFEFLLPQSASWEAFKNIKIRTPSTDHCHIVIISSECRSCLRSQWIPTALQYQCEWVSEFYFQREIKAPSTQKFTLQFALRNSSDAANGGSGAKP